MTFRIRHDCLTFNKREGQMAQQSNPTAGSPPAFIHRPKPATNSLLGDRTYSLVCAGVSVSRFPRETSASLTLRSREGSALSVFTRMLTAEQCEDLARALVDAAADLRRVEEPQPTSEDVGEVA
jgi:hypothetical protein